ncbi:MAG: hypothetical protein GEU90_21850, partial [Gemmatimonas sp.]|nr:hypothetical protein [Gemmatimonas sp.]
MSAAAARVLDRVPSRGRDALDVFRTSGGIGAVVLVALILVGLSTVEGFSSSLNMKSMLLFGSFLGIACIGQTL